MQWFGNLKTRTKLMGGFGLVCALMAIVGAFAVRELSLINGSTVVIAGNWLPALRAASAINTDISQHRLKLLRIAMTDNKAEHAQMERETAEVEARLAANRKLYESLLASPKERAIYDQFVKLADENTRKYNEVLALVRDSKSQQALVLLKGDSKLAAEALMAKINELVTFNNEGAQAATLAAGTAYTQARAWLVGLIAAGVGIALLLAFIIAGVISRPLSKAVDVLQAVADGDFTRTLDVTTKDEVGRLASALNQAVGGMRSALTDVRSSADAVASASLQLSAGSEEISSGAQEQASSLEETASSLEEIAATIKQSADNAQQANQLANGAREVAEKGGRVVSEAVQAMSEINQSSKQIAEIINTIDEIAFQTNLLALNAAVEAARAGEQGRGFAVVAAEVRNLAKRSATSAKEIKVLIQDSVRKVENGTSLVNQSGQTLHDIVTSVKRVTDIVGEIAAATREQATGIDQVNRAVTQMDTVTQSNAGQTEELASTAEALSSQAEQLQALVAKFRLEADGARHVSHDATARAIHTSHTAHRGRPGTRPLPPANNKSKKAARNTFSTNNSAPQREVLASRFSSLDDDAAEGAIFEEL